MGSWTSTATYTGPTKVEAGILVRDDDGTEPRARTGPDGSRHVHLGLRRVRARVADAAMVPSMSAADPDDRRSGQQPDTAGFLDFRRDGSGAWRARDRQRRRYRLLQSQDSQTYRVSSEEPDDGLPLGAQRQRAGDRALNGDLTKIHDGARHAADLARWAERMSDFWSRKPAE